MRITVSTSCFVPKPHSPFQWEAQVTMAEYTRRVKLLRDTMTAKAITYNWHDPDTSLVEAVLSRGDRRIGSVIYDVWKNGGVMQSWSEYFTLQRWMDAFEKNGLDPLFYAARDHGRDEILPWDRVNMGVTKRHLWNEREAAYRSELSPDCRAACLGCGAVALMNGGKCDG